MSRYCKQYDCSCRPDRVAHYERIARYCEEIRVPAAKTMDAREAWLRLASRAWMRAY